jgi:hypothetical protein
VAGSRAPLTSTSCCCEQKNEASPDLNDFWLALCRTVSHKALWKMFTLSRKVIHGKEQVKMAQNKEE